MSSSHQPPPSGFQTFAWDGVSFLMPADWNLSSYEFKKQATLLEAEDDTALRLQLEWVRRGKGMDVDSARHRCARLARKLGHDAPDRKTVSGLAAGWDGTLYAMPDGRSLLAAFFLPPGGAFFAFGRFHADNGPGARQAVEAARVLSASFRVREDAFVPWAFYDVAFETHREFRLVGTSLLAGRKLMMFEWRLRRLFVWHFSLADRLLGASSPQEWAAGFLNGFKPLRGRRFESVDDGLVAAARRRRYPFGHYEEIGRQCFRYHVKCIRDEAGNRLALVVYNYRKAADLERLSPAFR